MLSWFKLGLQYRQFEFKSEFYVQHDIQYLFMCIVYTFFKQKQSILSLKCNTHAKIINSFGSPDTLDVCELVWIFLSFVFGIISLHLHHQVGHIYEPHLMYFLQWLDTYIVIFNILFSILTIMVSGAYENVIN